MTPPPGKVLQQRVRTGAAGAGAGAALGSRTIRGLLCGACAGGLAVALFTPTSATTDT